MNRGCLFFQDNHFVYQQSYLIFKIEHFIPYFCFSQYYLIYVYISHVIYFSSAILIALNDHLELTVWCRLRDFFKDLIDIHSYSLFLVNSIFCCQLCFFFNFSGVWQIYVAEVLIIHICKYYHLAFLSPYEYQSEVNFRVVYSVSRLSSRSIFGL